MSNELVEKAIAEAKRLQSPQRYKNRIGSNWKPRSDHCVRHMEVPIPRGPERKCIEWQSGWKCLKRGPSGYCRKFEDPIGKKIIATDCATYVREVLRFAFENSGDKLAAIKQAREGGVGLCHYLVTKKNWKAVYWNRDVVRPWDGKLNHPTTYLKVAKDQIYRCIKGSKKDLSVAASVIQYAPTPKDKQETHYTNMLNKRNIPVPATSRDGLTMLKRIRFGVVSAHCGFHNALLLEGKVFEVHYGQAKGSSRLYDKTDFLSWKNGSIPWCSGLVVIPPKEWDRVKNLKTT